MASPESEFQPQKSSPPDTIPGGCLSGSTESPQPNSFSEEFFSKIGSNLVPSPTNIQPTFEHKTKIGSPTSNNSWKESEEQDDPYNRRETLGQTEFKDDVPLKSGWRTIGRADFNWRRELSENGQRLYRVLLYEMGHTDLLPELATVYEFGLDEALGELRSHHLVDERNPDFISLL